MRRIPSSQSSSSAFSFARFLSSDGQPILAARKGGASPDFRPPGRYRLPGVLVRMPSVPALLLRELAGILCFVVMLDFSSSLHTRHGNWAAALKPPRPQRSQPASRLLTDSLLLLATHALLSALRKAPSNQRVSAPEVVISALLSCAFLSILAGHLGIAVDRGRPGLLPPAVSSIICVPLTCAAVFHPSCRSPVWRWGRASGRCVPSAACD